MNHNNIKIIRGKFSLRMEAYQRDQADFKKYDIFQIYHECMWT